MAAKTKNKPAVPGFDGPRKTALESIRLHCVQCQGGSFALVADCSSKDCLFYPYRSGSIEPGASRRLLKVIRSYCDTCAPGGNVAGCTAGRCYLDLSACPIWPFRSGRSPYYSAEVREQRRARAISLFGNTTQEGDSAPNFNENTPTHTS
ncbi:hypothetical protein [Solidesulfovibrio magneticus]|uniref:hypothetical protein n=1 Tax=Solidesulfovibrio magneticus TaxID=184917 RepID=UPI0005B7BD72|nr:hypothetical protein [Solidesulfovibrio magneticus]